MKKLRIAVLIHKGLLPPSSKRGFSKEEINNWKVEYDVINTLKKSGHEVLPVEMFGELEPLRQALEEFKPHICFNLLEEFTEYPLFDQQVMNYLEMKKVPYTGCNPRGLVTAKDKALSKKILSFHKINIPGFAVYTNGGSAEIDSLNFPLFVKSLKDEGSVGISKESVVGTKEKLEARVNFLRERFGAEAIVEEYIEGREIYVGVMGNNRIKTLPPWELILRKTNGSPIATSRLKWDEGYQKKVGLITKAAKLPDPIIKKFEKTSKLIYRSLNLSGYARIDYKLTSDNKIYLIEANPNPFLAADEDFAASAKYIGIDYAELLRLIINYGLNYKPFE